MTYESVRDLFSRKRTIEVLVLLNEQGTMNYSEIAERIETSSDIVSDRLTRLSEAGLIDRTEYSKRDVRYSITEKGREIASNLEKIDEILDYE